MSINIVDSKRKILEYVSEKGPSLPVHFTKITGLSLTFTSAILSELLRERKLKLSNIRVGTSPLYLIPGQEDKLENFTSNLKQPEIEAFIKLKENKILDDEKQDPIIRVALRSIRDFAIPIKKGDKLFWKYHLLSDEKALESIGGLNGSNSAIGQERVIGQKIWEDIQKENISREMIEEIVQQRLEEIKVQSEKNPIEEVKLIEASEEEDSSDDILETSEKDFTEESERKEILDSKFNNIEVSVSKKSISKKKAKISKKDLFLEEAKKILEGENYLNIEILNNDATKLVAISKTFPEILCLVYNKKRVTEEELMKDLKKFNDSNRKVRIFLKGEITKKIGEKVQLFSLIEEFSKIGEQ